MSPTDEPGASPPPASTPRSPALAVVLAWLFPGLGHAYLGWRGRGLVYAIVLVVMFVAGLLLEGSLSRPGSGAYLASLATLADLGNGSLYFLAQAGGWATGRAASATHEAGNAFHWSAGVMNMLLVLDAWDIATGRKTRGAARP